MRSIDNTIKESTEAFIPEATGEYERMMNETITELRARAEIKAAPGRVLWRALAAAAAVFAALIVTAAAVFAARPALAAEVPVVNDIVYAVSPNKTANEADCERIEALVMEVFQAFAVHDYDAAECCFTGDAMHTRDSYFAAAYTEQMQKWADVLPENADVGELEVSELSAQQKAFRYACRVTLTVLSRDGSYSRPEECVVRIWENAEGMHIESLQMQSERYAGFVQKYEESFGIVPEDGEHFGLIPFAYWCMIIDRVDSDDSARSREGAYNQMLRELDELSAPEENKAVFRSILLARLEQAQAEITPEMVSIEDLAEELMYRYWLGGITGEVSDFSDILEHNEDTDLFLWDAKFQAEALIPAVYGRFDTLTCLGSTLYDMSENPDGTITAHLSVNFEWTYSGNLTGVGDAVILTLRPEGKGFMVIGFDREIGDGIFNLTLKPAAQKYKAAGYSWQEAGEIAYEEALSQLG